MTRELSAAEQQKRRRERQARREARAKREYEASRGILPNWANAIILIGATALGGWIAWVLGPVLLAADPFDAALRGAVTGAVSGLIAASGVLGGLQMPRPKWWFATAGALVGAVMFFAVMDAMRPAVPLRPWWMVGTVLMTVGWFGPMIVAVSSVARKGWKTLGIGVVLLLAGGALLIVGLRAESPVYVGLGTVSGRPVDYSPADGIAPIALAVGGLIMVTLGALALIGLAWSLRRASPR